MAEPQQPPGGPEVVTVGSYDSSSKPESWIGRIVTVKGLPVVVGVAHVTTSPTESIDIVGGRLVIDHVAGIPLWVRAGASA